MKYLTESEFKKEKSLFDEQLKIIEDFKKDKIDKLTFLRRMEEISTKLVEIASFKSKSFEEFERFMINFKFTDAMGNIHYIPNIKERIQHEREHAKIMEKYGVDNIYCFIVTRPILLPPQFIYVIERLEEKKQFHQAYVVDSLLPKAEKWSKEEILNYLKEVFMAGTELPLSEKLCKEDMKFVKILEEP